jgi:hypothetical protein
MPVASAQLGLWPERFSYVAKAVDKMAGPPEIPPAPSSQTRIRLSMVKGYGDRQTECNSYERCLDEAVRQGGDRHCPVGCGGFIEVSREERLYEAIIGRSRSPLADAQDEAPLVLVQPKRHDIPNPNAKPVRAVAPRVLEALAAGPMTTKEIAKATGISRQTLSGRLADMVRDGLVRRVGRVRVHERTGAMMVRWERVER